MTRSDVERVAVALVGRAAVFADTTPSADALALDHDLMGGEGLDVGGRVLDSLELSEWVFALEDDLDITLTELDQVDRVRTLRSLATFLTEIVEPDRLEAFCDRWAAWYEPSAASSKAREPSPAAADVARP